MRIKYINYLLSLVAIIGSFYIIVVKDRELGVILKDASILVTITLPYILEKIFKIKIDNKLKFIYILFVFCAHFLGATVELYNKISWYDKLCHTLSGVLTSYGALLILTFIKNCNIENKFFNIMYMICVTLAVASLWEIFEYTANILFGGDAQKVVQTGVNDTMQDIIVAFIGSLFVCLIYGFYSTLNIFNFTNSVKKID